jgi:hypothetical protein
MNGVKRVVVLCCWIWHGRPIATFATFAFFSIFSSQARLQFDTQSQRHDRKATKRMCSCAGSAARSVHAKSTKSSNATLILLCGMPHTWRVQQRPLASGHPLLCGMTLRVKHPAHGRVRLWEYDARVYCTSLYLQSHTNPAV